MVPLSSINAVTLKDDAIYMDPQLLFQRLLTAGTRKDNLLEVFQYELCSYPSALFENRTTSRLANKAALADALWKMMLLQLMCSTYWMAVHFCIGSLGAET